MNGFLKRWARCSSQTFIWVKFCQQGKKNYTPFFPCLEKGESNPNHRMPEYHRVSGVNRSQAHYLLCKLCSASLQSRMQDMLIFLDSSPIPSRRSRTTSIFFGHRGLFPLSGCLTLNRRPVGHIWFSRITFSRTGLCNSRWHPNGLGYLKMLIYSF